MAKKDIENTEEIEIVMGTEEKEQKSLLNDSSEAIDMDSQGLVEVPEEDMILSGEDLVLPDGTNEAPAEPEAEFMGDDENIDAEIDAFLSTKTDKELEDEISAEEKEEDTIKEVEEAAKEDEKKPNSKKRKEKVDLSYVSDETWMMLYAAWKNEVPLEGYRGETIETIGKQRCIILHIPDPVYGVKCILPEKLAGLRENEELESLMSYPSLRLSIVQIDRDNGIVVLNRKSAERQVAARTWRTVEKDDTVDAFVLGIQRGQSGKATRLYCDVGGVLAILPVSELSHNYMEDVDYVRGDSFKVKVLLKNEFENADTGEKRRYFLISLKATQRDPWKIEHCVPMVKTPYNGTIIKKVQTGMFVLLPSGIIVKTPHYSPNYNGKHSVGDTIAVYPAIVDRATRRVYARLTLRDSENFINRYEARRNQRVKKVAQ